MKVMPNPFRGEFTELQFPDHAKVISSSPAFAIENPDQAIKQALKNPIGSPSLEEIAISKKQKNKNAIRPMEISRMAFWLIFFCQVVSSPPAFFFLSPSVQVGWVRTYRPSRFAKPQSHMRLRIG